MLGNLTTVAVALADDSEHESHKNEKLCIATTCVKWFNISFHTNCPLACIQW